MSSPAAIRSRNDLSASQISSLQRSLDIYGRGKVIDVPLGAPYDDQEVETVARVGEGLTKYFTSPSFFAPGGWRVRFVLLESEASNAYAYWMTSFEAICITTTLAREIDSFCEDVAKFIVLDSDKGGGFAFLQDIELLPEQKWEILKGILIQGAMAVFVGHEVGHLAAGHKPVMTSTSDVAHSVDALADDSLLYVDDLMGVAAADESAVTPRILRLNAHEVDADVQGFGLTARYWQKQRDQMLADQEQPFNDPILKAVCVECERLLLIACTGASIAVSLMGYKTFASDWNRQRTHPLTAVRCIVGLSAFAQLLLGNEGTVETQLLRPECIEALSVVHARLGTIALAAAKIDGKHSDLTLRLEDAPDDEQRLQLVFKATGVAQSMAYSNDVVRYIGQLSEEFNACATLRRQAIRALPNRLVEWSVVVIQDLAAQATDITTLAGS